MGRIGAQVGLYHATVGRILKRFGLNWLAALEPTEPPRLTNMSTPGDLLQLDIKKLPRFRQPGHRLTGIRTKDSIGIGWAYVHVAIDDCSRLAFSELHPTEDKGSAIDHLRSAVRYYERLGIRIRRLLTDNGACYRSKAFAQVCHELGIKHRFTHLYRPRNNGKAERFIQTVLREWPYAFAYQTFEERAEHLPRWQHEYNWHRKYGSLNHTPPISKLGLPEDNLKRLHI